MSIYNCADTLEEALDSLMNQTFKDFKVVLCDDASADNTYDVAQEYIKKYPYKFILIKNDTNMKLAASLNRCLEYADTEYVARMDGDDISRPERFQKEIEFLDTHPEFALVSCAMDYFDENGIFRTGKVIAEPTKKNFINATPHCHAPVMIRTEAIKSVDGYTVEKWTQRGQDVYLWAKLYSKGHKGFNLAEPLYAMRDDLNAFKRRKFKDALLGIQRTSKIYSMLKIPKYYLLLQIKSLASSIAPKFIYDYFHRK